MGSLYQLREIKQTLGFDLRICAQQTGSVFDSTVCNISDQQVLPQSSCHCLVIQDESEEKFAYYVSENECSSISTFLCTGYMYSQLWVQQAFSFLKQHITHLLGFHLIDLLYSINKNWL